jgi:hypothetical protein
VEVLVQRLETEETELQPQVEVVEEEETVQPQEETEETEETVSFELQNTFNLTLS